MLSRLLVFISLGFLLIQFAFSQVEESHVDFSISPSLIQEGEIHVAYEWLKPHEFTQKELSVIDLVKVNAMHPGNNQLVASKISLVSQQKFDDLTFVKMNTAEYISKMLNSVGITQKTSNTWRVTNKVKAYGLPFKVSFDLLFKEVSPASLAPQVVRYLRDEASVIKSSGRERFLSLDMTNFTQLMYRNYSFVYLKELPNNETLIVSGIVAGVDLDRANSYFNYPPISRTETTMMNNMRRQIIHMAREIQKPN